MKTIQKPHYEAHNGDLFEIYLDQLGEVKRVIVYRDRTGPGRPLGKEEKLPEVVVERLMKLSIKRLLS